jgi:predicted permease
MDWLTRDVATSVRRLLKDRVFSVTSVLTLAICIGANTALFAVVYNVLLRPLPVPAPEQIVLMSNRYPNAGAADSSNSGVPDYFDRLQAVTALGEQALVDHGTVAMGRDDRATRLHVAWVTPSFFRMLGVAPILGRTFGEDEAEVGNDNKVVLTEGFWKSTFAGDPSVVGREIHLDGRPFTVVGVMPSRVDAVDPGVQLWRVQAFTAEERSDDNRHSNSYWNLARLKPGATVEQAQAQVDALNAANMARFPQYKDLLVKAGFHTKVDRYQDHVVRHVSPTLRLLWGGALFVLLIGCLNVGNLALVRARARAKDLATRRALGARPADLVRQFLVEGLLLTLLAAGLGLGIGEVTLRTLGALDLKDLPYGTEVGLSRAVVLYTVALAVVIGIAMGLVPVVSALRANLNAVLREEGRASTGGRHTRVLRHALVVVQVAFTFVLLIGAGLLFASFRKVLAVDPGFSAERVMTATVALPRSRYAEDANRRTFAEESLRRLRALPGVESAGITDTIPFGDRSNDSVILAEGYQMKPEESVVSPAYVKVTPGYFETMGVKIARGRFFTDADGAGAPPVIIVDEKLAQKFWPGQDPIGRRMYRPTELNNLLAVTEKTVFLTVVGVIEDVKLHDLTEGETTVGTYYTPLSQDLTSTFTFAVKTSGVPQSVAQDLRRTITALDPELPIYDLQTMEQRSATALLDKRTPAMLSLAFGLIALLLSSVGIYGVLAYLVTQRAKEIGIRIALGSTTRGIFDLVLQEGLLLVGIGLAIGAGFALLLRKALDSVLYGVSSTDPMVLAGTTALLAGVALLACAIPARRATRIDPVTVLTE